jgi:hypothetical protein
MAVHSVTNKDWQKIYRKSWKDADFRMALERDPHAAVRDWIVEEYNDPDATLDKVLDSIEETIVIPTACC